MDQDIRNLRYRFWRLSYEERFLILVNLHLVTREMIEMVPIEFFKAGFEHAIIDVGADRLLEHPLLKENA